MVQTPSMPDFKSISPKEAEDNYQFIITRRLLIRDFPWIKNVRLPDPDKLNKYSLIFLTFDVDPWEYAKLNPPAKVVWYVALHGKDKFRGQYWSPYFTSMFTKDSRDIAQEGVDKVERYIKQISTSQAIPPDLKLPSQRKFSIGDWYVDDNAIPDPEYTSKMD